MCSKSFSVAFLVFVLLCLLLLWLGNGCSSCQRTDLQPDLACGEGFIYSGSEGRCVVPQ